VKARAARRYGLDAAGGLAEVGFGLPEPKGPGAETGRKVPEVFREMPKGSVPLIFSF